MDKSWAAVVSGETTTLYSFTYDEIQPFGSDVIQS
jgi:hypothetical protein